MSNKNIITKKMALISFFCLVFFILDRVLKYLALAGKIFYYQNSGLWMSINIPDQLFHYFIISLSFIFIFLVYDLIKSIEQKKCSTFIVNCLLIFGGASNVLDRIKFGFIIDYINLGLVYNNLADVMIVAGAVILVINFLKTKGLTDSRV